MRPKTQLDNPNQRLLYEYLSKLSLLQFKQFYCLFVHYWTNYKCFISQQNLFNLWCELNQLCHESDESFPDQYDTYIEQGGTNVSGGQKQRLCIARALLKKPKILILDDSTSAVDTKTDALIRKAFRDEIPDTTKLIIAQRISSVEDADKVIILNEGKIVAFDTPANLLANNDIYKEIYTSQMKGGEANG